MHPLMHIDDVARVGQALFVNNALEHTDAGFVAIFDGLTPDFSFSLVWVA